MIQLRIGNQTSFSAYTALVPFEYAVENGFNAFEWFPDKKEDGPGWDIVDIDDEIREYIKEKALAHDIVLSVHAPWNANPLSSEGQRRIGHDVEFARAIGAGLVNIHVFLNQGVEAFVQNLLPIIKLTSDAGLQLSLENTAETSPEDMNRLFSLFPGLPAETGHVGMCFDLGHANLYAQTHNNYLGYLDRLSPEIPIIHVHMHENYGDKDSHLTLFTGPAGEDDVGMRGLVDRLKSRNFAGSIILEQWPSPPILLNQARDRIHCIWKKEC